jgi:hypothetical protein
MTYRCLLLFHLCLEIAEPPPFGNVVASSTSLCVRCSSLNPSEQEATNAIDSAIRSCLVPRQCSALSSYPNPLTSFRSQY